MEKQIKMSLETARKWMQSIQNKTLSEGDPKTLITNIILETFTLEELEGKKCFTWEESFSFTGFYIHQIEGKVLRSITNEYPPKEGAKALFKTEKQALSALAFAQLTHIVAKYNEGKEFRPGPNCRFEYWEISTIDHTDGVVRLLVGAAQTNIISKVNTGLKFNRMEEAITSMNVNKELWEQYWMI